MVSKEGIKVNKNEYDYFSTVINPLESKRNEGFRGGGR